MKNDDSRFGAGSPEPPPLPRRSRWAWIVSTLAALGAGLVLAFLLGIATSNPALYERHYVWLFWVNVALASTLVAVIVVAGVRMLWRVSRGRFGSRLLLKLAAIFALVGILPGVLIYAVSYQFVSRSIETWFDVKVEGALDAGLNLGRGTIDTIVSDLATKTRLAAERLGESALSAEPLSLERLREQLSAKEISIVGASGQTLLATASASAGLRPARLVPVVVRVCPVQPPIPTTRAQSCTPSPARAIGAHLPELLLRRPLGIELEARGARAGDDLTGAGPQHDVAGTELVADALERQTGAGIGHLRQLAAGRARLDRQIVRKRVQRRSPQVEAGVERALDLDVEPALDRARDELVADGVDQHPRQDADEGEDRRQLEQQPAAEAAARDAPEHAHGGDDDHCDERAGERDVDPVQPEVVPLVEGRVVGRDAEQEREDEAGAERRQGRDDPRPAAAAGQDRGLGVARFESRVVVQGERRALTGCATCGGPKAASRVGRRCRSASAAAAV